MTSSLHFLSQNLQKSSPERVSFQRRSSWSTRTSGGTRTRRLSQLLDLDVVSAEFTCVFTLRWT
ncbi:hypothetical protein INR49_027206 [Caranx melampygus]|nr:hypothetical protein INR49_027221 [Caranx melampygus]KAG7240199.1 hypothetical protein INR49_027206 [Caranx melampygus]